MNAKKSEKHGDFSADIFASYLKVLANPTRLKIVDLLERGEHRVGDIEKALHVSQSNVSQHLRILKDRGILTSRKSANEVFYSVIDKGLFGVIDKAREFFHSIH